MRKKGIVNTFKLYFPLQIAQLLLLQALPYNHNLIYLVASFILTFFLVAYFTTVFKTIKNNGEEEFIILREIPTVLGRLAVFDRSLSSRSYHAS